MKLTMKEWRIVKMLRQSELAKAIGISVPTLVEWEKHPEKIQLGKTYAIADALGVSVEDVLFMNPEDSDYERVFQNILDGKDYEE